MIEVLLSLCLGLINSARGSGIKNMKFPELFAMSLVAYTITHDLWLSLIFPIPQALVFAIGTGFWMPWIVRKLSFLGFGNNTWRLFEFLSVFLYSLIYLSIIQL